MRYYIVQKVRKNSTPIGVAICPTLDEATIILLQWEIDNPKDAGKLQIVKSREIETGEVA